MSRLPSAFFELTDASGDPISGGQLFTYEAGTTSNKATYSDRELTIANANPVVADAAGVVGPVYLTPNELYKFTIKDASDVTIRSEDDVYSVLTSDADANASLKQLASSPTDFGAIGDGVADESSQVQDAIDAITARGVVDLRGLTFRCDSQIVLPTGITLRNGVLNFSNCTDDEYVKAHGTLGSSVDLSSDSTVSTVPLASASGFAVGDICNITSDASFNGGSAKRGELFIIASISGGTLTTVSPLYDAYTTGANAAIKKLTALDDVTLEHLKIVGPASAGADNGISLINCNRARVRDVVFTGTYAAALYIGSSYETSVEGCSFVATKDAAVQEIGSSQATRIRDCHFTGEFDDVYSAVGNATIAGDTESAVGVPRDVLVSKCDMRVYLLAATHAVFQSSECEYVTFELNTIRVVPAAINTEVFIIGCVNMEVRNNTFRVDNSAISLSGDPCIEIAPTVPAKTDKEFSIRILGNQIWTTGLGIFASDAGSTNLDLVEISDNKIYSEANGTIRITDLICDYLAVRRNVCQESGGGNSGRIDIETDLVASTMPIVEVSHNISDDIIIDATTNGTISEARTIGNVCTNYDVFSVNEIVSQNDTVDGGAQFDECTILHITGLMSRSNCVISNDTAEFTSCLVSGCTFDTAAGVALEIGADFAATDSSALVVTGCLFPSATTGIMLFISGYLNNIAVSGNTFARANDNASCIQLTGGAAGSITNGMISGNTFVNGTYGINASNTSNIYAGINTYISQSSGNHNGLANGNVTNNAGATDYTLDASPGTAQNNNEFHSAVITELLNLGLFQ